MNIRQHTWSAEGGWTSLEPLSPPAGLVLVFGAREALSRPAVLDPIRALHPGAPLVGCSTAGEILESEVRDGTITATAVHFDDTRVRVVWRRCDDESSERIGAELGGELAGPELVHVFVLSDGLHVNGSELVRGFGRSLPHSVGVTGGLSGDAAKFEHTLVIADGEPRERTVVAVGFYGSRLRVGCGSQGGWDQFGPTRIVTRATGNVLYELDGEPALDVYRRYLGDHADRLPASGLLFPLSITLEGAERQVVRTILGIDAESGSMTFAGDIPQGARARLMKANFERLIDGAVGAADATRASITDRAELAILISCVGRKLVLGQRIDEEVEAVRAVLGESPVMTGFYSYGEISPFTPNARCELHNQTMTITTFAEA